MEFGFEPVCDQVRASSSYLDMSEAGRRKVRGWSLVADLLARALSLVAS